MALFDAIKNKLGGVRQRWSNGLTELFGGRSVDQSFWEDLEETLIAGDTGLETAEALVEELRRLHRARGGQSSQELLGAFKELLIQRLQQVPRMGEAFHWGGGLGVILMVGVNGSGKTTTTGKVATLLASQGAQVVVAAADTFRAAAIEQLQTWCQRAQVRLVAQKQGSDAAAVVFDAITSARSSGADLLLVDTAGRLQSKHNLMEELGKIYRVIHREIDPQRLESVLVLDAVMGQNAFKQAQLFHQVAPLTGVVLAKYDNTAKGGIVLPIAQQLQLPIRYVGLGESAQDLELFDPATFVEALMAPQEQEPR